MSRGRTPALHLENSSRNPTYAMEDFVGHLRRVPGLEDQGREEIIAELKTSVEPFRSLYYVKINYVRYLKGLKNFQKSL